jgi:hypothetical protein
MLLLEQHADHRRRRCSRVTPVTIAKIAKIHALRHELSPQTAGRVLAMPRLQNLQAAL